MRYFTSDHHFWHSNIIKYCNRPFKDAEEMNEIMILRWNEIVKPEDTVYYLGDFSMTFRSVELFANRLNGIKKLILGNHDFAHPAHRKARNEEHIWRKNYIDNGFESVALEDRILIDGKTVLLNHMPYTGDSKEPERYQDFRPLDLGLPLLHGHVHTRWKTKGNQINVGVDCWDFKPVSEDQIKELLSQMNLVISK